MNRKVAASCVKVLTTADQESRHGQLAAGVQRTSEASPVAPGSKSPKLTTWAGAAAGASSRRRATSASG